METRANYAIVGLFTMLVMLSAFGFIYWMAKYGGGGETAPLIVRIPGSANGLSVGSPVRFNGIQYGVIRRLSIDPESPKFVIAMTEVQANTPIYTDTSAALEIQGLTGSAYIEMQGGTPSNENILLRAMTEGRIAEITADPSSVTNLLATADDILNRANRVVGQVEGFVVDARGPLTETLRNTETFTGALRDNADGIDDFLQSVGNLSEVVKAVSGRVESALASAENLINAVDPEKIDRILANVDTATSEVAAASGTITQSLERFGEAAESLQTLASTAGASVERVNAIIAGIDPAKAGQAIDDIAAASADARLALADARVMTETFSARTEDYDVIISDVREMTGTLNAASGNITQTLERFGEAAESLQTLASTAGASLEKVDAMIAGIDPAKAGQAVDDIAAASADARKALADARGVAETFSARTEDYDLIISDVREMTSTLNAASARVDGVLAKVDGFLGEGDASNLLADAEATLQSFRDVAASLNARIGPIADNLERFSGSGLSDVQALVNDARRSIQRIEQSISTIEQDPQRFIFGGDAVKQYDGRTRR